MTRLFGYVAIFLIGMALGGAASSLCSNTPIATAAADDTVMIDADAIRELREIKSHAADINTLLHSGTVRVIVVLSPEIKP